MSATQFLHGVEVLNIDDGARPIQTVSSSVIGVIGTAPQSQPNVQATLQDNGTIAGNNSIAYTAVAPGSLGNKVSISYVNPNANSAALSVSVSNQAITVNLATGPTGAITTTAAQVIAALAANPQAAALVTGANNGASTGASAVTAMPAKLLSGGIDAAFPLNTPVLVAGSPAQAALLGPKGTGTLPDAMDSILNQTGAVCIVVRVADGGTPATMNDTGTVVANDQLTYTAVDGGSFGNGISVAYVNPNANNAPLSVTVNGLAITVNLATNGSGAIVTTAAQVIAAINASAAAGLVTVANTSTSTGVGVVAAMAATHLTGGVDLSTTTLANVVGGVNSQTGQYQGVHAFLGAEHLTGYAPRILIAPGWTHQRPNSLANPVVAELLGIATSLRGVIIADGPNTTDADAQTYAADWGSKRIYMHDPWDIKLDVNGNPVNIPASSRIAGQIAFQDNANGFWWSPSNQQANGIIGTGREIDFQLGNPNCRANLLNGLNIATTIRQNGYRLWGNRTLSSDPKWQFLSVVRTADIINDSLLRAHLWAVDRNITKTYVEDVTEGVNNYLRYLVKLGAILGGKCWADPSLNTAAAITNGQVFFDFDFLPPFPAEHVTFRSHLNNNYISEIFK